MNALANHQILNFNEEGKPISSRFKFLVYSIFYFLYCFPFRFCFYVTADLSVICLCTILPRYHSRHALSRGGNL